eukprot:tig00021251_g19648.t1
MSSAVEKLLCTCSNRIRDAARSARRRGLRWGGGGGAQGEGGGSRAAVAENDQGGGQGQERGGAAPRGDRAGAEEAAHAATAALAARRQAEAYPCLGGGCTAAGRPYAVSAYFDEANRLSCQELCDNRMRRAVDGHLPLLVALGGSLLMVWYLRGLVI